MKLLIMMLIAAAIMEVILAATLVIGTIMLWKH
jgi:hypothetical protein